MAEPTKLLTAIQGDPPIGAGKGRRRNPVITAMYNELVSKRNVWFHVNIPITSKKQLASLRASLSARATKDNTSRIVNIGSIDGIGTPSFETYSYGPSKAAVHSLTKVLAGRLASRHIIVNAIAPGPFPTWMLSTGVGGGGDVDNTDWDTVGRMNPSGRVGTPEDIAGLALYLCSRAGAFTVGEVITCDGGSLLK
jgi:NAD(P)-dependent dehydrogenase (short-subunit alcohol dehydrogenase family)